MSDDGRLSSRYLEKGFEPSYAKSVVRSFKAALKDKVFGDFEAIAVRGVSGMLFGPMLAHMTKKRLSVIRKPRETKHTNRILEGVHDTKRYVIVDDFVSSGETVQAIVCGMKQSPFRPMPAGLFMWCRDSCDGYGLMHGCYSEPTLWEGLPLVGVTRHEPYYTVCKCGE